MQPRELTCPSRESGMENGVDIGAGVEPLRFGRRPKRFVKKQTRATKRPVGVRMAACKEGGVE
ncbi:MAG: hypothetical protein PVG39_21550 [Desulfobacteraceae bacterium]